MEVKYSKGCIYTSVSNDIVKPYLNLVDLPSIYGINRRERDGSNYHITVTNPDEIIDKKQELLCKSLPTSLLFILGIGVASKDNDEVYYIVVHHPGMNKIRKEMGLDAKPFFHITLGFKYKDIHQVEKGIQTILKPNYSLNVDNCYHINSIVVLEYIYTITGYCDPKLRILRCKKNVQILSDNHSCNSNNNSDSDTIMALVLDINALKEQGNYIYLYLTYYMKQALNQLMPTLVELEEVLPLYNRENSNIHARYDNNSVYISHIITQYNTIQMKMPVGTGTGSWEDNSISNSNSNNTSSSSEGKFKHLLFIDAHATISTSTSTNTHSHGDGDKEHRGQLIKHEMPRNFCWVKENIIGGISAIRNIYDVLALMQLGIKHIFYFLERAHFHDIMSSKVIQERDDILKVTYVYCENTKTPSIADMTRVCTSDTFSHGPVLFGCLGGFGRTGTALSCYLVKYGRYITNHKEIRDTDLPLMSANDAVSYLRSFRPKSIENAQQLSYVHQYANYLYMQHSEGGTVENGPNPNPNINSNQAHNTPAASSTRNPLYKDIKLVMMVGLPASGE